MQQLNFNSENELLSTAEIIRLKSTNDLHPLRKRENSQYFTPLAIAEFMASMISYTQEKMRILDPGAGTGILTASVINQITKSKLQPEHILIKAIETDSSLIPHLTDNLVLCKQRCDEFDIECEVEVESSDFIEFGVENIKSYSNQTNLFTNETGCEKFDLIIMNPPYKWLLLRREVLAMDHISNPSENCFLAKCQYLTFIFLTPEQKHLRKMKYCRKILFSMLLKILKIVNKPIL